MFCYVETSVTLDGCKSFVHHSNMSPKIAVITPGTKGQTSNYFCLIASIIECIYWSLIWMDFTRSQSFACVCEQKLGISAEFAASPKYSIGWRELLVKKDQFCWHHQSSVSHFRANFWFNQNFMNCSETFARCTFVNVQTFASLRCVPTCHAVVTCHKSPSHCSHWTAIRDSPLSESTSRPVRT